MEATYAAERPILDGDAHIMEPPGWLESCASSRVCDRIPVASFGDPAFGAKIEHSVAAVDPRRTDTAGLATVTAEFMTMPARGGAHSATTAPTSAKPSPTFSVSNAFSTVRRWVESVQRVSGRRSAGS